MSYHRQVIYSPYMNIDTDDYDITDVFVNGDGFASVMSSSLHVTGWHYSLWRLYVCIIVTGRLLAASED